MRTLVSLTALVSALSLGCGRTEFVPLCSGLLERRVVESVSLLADSTSAMHSARPGYRSANSVVFAVSEGPDVLSIDSRGALQFRTGSRGSGPGEYRSLVAVTALGPDSMLAFDDELWRLSVLTAEGRFVRSLTIDPITYGSVLGISVVGRTLLVAALRRPDPRTVGLDGIMPESLTVISFSLDSAHHIGHGVPEVTVAGGLWKREPTVGSVRVRRLPEGPNATFAAYNGFAFAASGGERVLYRRERSGEWRPLKLDFLPEQESSTTAGTRSALFDVVVAGEDTTAWIGLPLIVERTTRTWVRARQDGTADSCMELPTNLWIWQVDSAGVLGRLIDPEGDDRVVLYRWRNK